MFDFRMPSLGADMEKGKVVAWHVKVGDAVQKGDIILDVETDKGVIAVDVWETGEISDILIPPGETVAIGTTLAHIKKPQEIVVTQIPQKSLAEHISLPQRESKPLPREKELTTKRRISPLARRVAKDLGIDLNALPMLSTGEAIHKKDVEEFAASRISTPSKIIKSLPSPVKAMDEERAPPSPEAMARFRSAVSTLMSRSKREIPHYYLDSEIRLASAMDWLERLNASRGIKNRILPIALLLKATARAAASSEGFNGFYRDNAFQPSKDVHLGVIVSLRQGGIVSPALRHADQLPLDDIMQNLMDLISRARHGKLKSSEISKQTITVSSLGDTGVDRVQGIIYPPQVALVGFGSIKWRVQADKNSMTLAPSVWVSLAADHRTSDGLTGANFLREIAKFLSHPENL